MKVGYKFWREMKELIAFFVGFEGFCVCDDIGFDKLGFTVRRYARSGSGF